jgi:HAD superfamily hydrolase (TIGR01509 family)
MLDKLNAHPNEAIFIDDLDSNVKAAEKLGITGITVCLFNKFQ